LESLKGRDHSESLEVDVEDNVKIYLMEIGFGGVDWIRLAQERDH
jgi:hypothetical protein